MEVLYVKINSERKKSLQVRTIIFKKNGIKYVRKEALNSSAIGHINKIVSNHKKLSTEIVNSKIRLVPIIEHDSKSVTFEFIEGVSLEQKFHNALKNDNNNIMDVVNEYKELLYSGFKTTLISNNMINESLFRKLFGNIDLKYLESKIAFKNVSNIDLIFSNIIYSGDNIYLIDYEWVYDVPIPIDFIIFRQFENFVFPNNLREMIYNKLGIMQYKEIFTQMNINFIMNNITDSNSFYRHSNNYEKPNYNYIQNAQNSMHLQNIIADLQKQLSDIQLHKEDSLKSKIKPLIPLYIWNKLKTIKWFLIEMKQNFKKKPIEITSYRYLNPNLNDEIYNTIKNFEKKPLISIITPVYNVDPKWLEKAIESVKKQWYNNWELCIVDDCSTNVETKEYLQSINNPKVKIKFLDQNLNISGASNEALKLANGEYISLLDNDDELTPNALYEMVKEINSSSADFIYSDEDFIDTNGVCSNPHYKPDFSPNLLLSHNYITHLTCFKKKLLDSVGWFKSEFDGAQDYELFLRLTEKAKKISHIPKVLYHWRTIEGSTSVNSEAKPEAMKRAKRALEETLKRRGIDGWVEYGNINHYFRVRYIIKNNPLVSIIIPFKDKSELLDMCINSILQKSSYKNYEIIGVSNNSEDEATFEKMRELERKDPRVKFYEYNIEFNYAKINNYAVENLAKGEHILLLNNDIEVINSDWIEAMLEHSQREEVGCIGAKLYYPDDTIQHAGIIIGLGGRAGHSHKKYPKDNPGYFNRLNCVQNISAVTAACLMVEKSIYIKCNGMDEVRFKVAYNDVDFCLRVREKGYLNIFTPYAELYHHESISRGYETTPEKKYRFELEKESLRVRHLDILTNGDPYYNKNLTLDTEDFSICLN